MTTEEKLRIMFEQNEKNLVRLRKRMKGLQYYIIKTKRKGYEEFLSKRTLKDRLSLAVPPRTNDIALANITEYLINKVNETTEERDMWKARCEELEENKKQAL